MGTKVGSKKICPLMSEEFSGSKIHCLDDCEWNDGEGCAIWRIVKAQERMNYWLEVIAKAVIQND